MNKIYRIIWSKVKHGWIVVSEIAKRCGKAGSQTVRATVGGSKGATGSSLAVRAVCSLLLGAVLAAGYSQPAVWAETKDEPIIYAKGVSVDGSMDDIISEQTGSAFGYRTTASGSRSTAFGVATTASGFNSTAFGFETTASHEDSTAFGYGTTASGIGSTAFGGITIACGIDSTAFGYMTKAIGIGSTAFGYMTKASGIRSTAFGSMTTASGHDSTAFGSNSKAGIMLYGAEEARIEWYRDGEKEKYRIVRVADAVVLDDNSGSGYVDYLDALEQLTVYGQVSTAFGIESKAYADNSLAALGGYTEINATNSAAIGNGAKASLADTVALGSGAVANRAAYNADSNNYTAYLGDASKTGAAWQATHNAIAVGASANDSDTATVTRQITGVAAGTYDTDAVNVAQLKAATAIAITDAHNYYDGSTDAVAVTDAVNAVDKALGKVEAGNYITAYDATAGTGTFADNLKALDEAIGTKIEKDGNFIKKSDTNSVNANIMALDEALGQNVEAIKDNKKAIDKNTGDISALKAQDGQVVPEGKPKADEFVKGETVYDYLNKDDLFFGDNSTKIAIGKGSKVQSGTQSLAIGFGNTVDGDQNVAIGTGHTVKGSHNIAIGDPIELVGDNNGVIGNNSTITGNDNFVIGNGSTVKGNNTFVLGNNVTANANNAVVLGNNSTAEENAVSVGSAGGERQIKHVKAGTDDTDAVNVSQLKALEQQATDNDVMLNNRINNVDNKINKVGAGAAALAALHPLDTDDKFSMGLGYGNYRDAHAGAIGLFYRPTDKVMLSVAGSMGNGENMINAGITFALDKGKGFGTSKAAMARKINQQENQIQALQIENAKLAERLAAIEAKLAK